MRIGAHVSSSGSLDLAIDRAVAIGAEAVQIFCSPPQGWAFKPLDEKVVTAFKNKALEQDIGPNALHGVYLTNLGAQDKDNRAKGVLSLTNYMNAAHDLGMLGVIFHVGSHRGVGFDTVFQQIIDSLNQVLANSPDDTYLMLENSAGMGNSIGSKFSELGAMVKAMSNPRIKVCLDTQHSFSSGYDLTTPESVAEVMEEFDREVGVSELMAVHCNDSKPPLGGGLDRHENIGEGHMGLPAFEAIMGHPAFREVPFYLEVPGFEGKGPDVRNVETLKTIRGNLPVPA
jgi:deoxyribonuclease IV